MKKLYLLLILVFNFCIESYAQELTPFQKEGKFGFKNKKSEVIAPKFDYACYFTNGLALVKLNGLWGYIDSIGNFKIKPQFENAQPFINNTASVYLKGKMGIIQTNGTYSIKPEYTKCIESNNGFYTFLNDKKGFIFRNSKLEIFPLYIELIEASPFISAKNPNSTWDIYLEGKLILKDSPTSVNYAQINQATKTVILERNKRFGIYHFEKGWIIQPIYQSIETVPFFYYSTINSMDNYEIYALYKHKSINNEESDITEGFSFEEDTIQFAKINGEFISKEYYSSYTTVMEEDPDGYGEKLYAFQVNKFGTIGFINKDFTINQTKFNSLTPFIDIYVGAIDQKMCIVSADFQIVNTFKSITTYKEKSYIGEFNDLGEEMYIDIDVYEPFLIVTNDKSDQNNEYAIYDLKENRIISPWLKSSPTVSRTINNQNENVIYVYTDGISSAGFYTSGMSIGTALVFESVYSNTSDFIYAQLKENKGVELYFITNNSIRLIHKEHSIIPSSLIKAFYQNDDLGEGYQTSLFNNDFPYVTNVKGKYGLVSQNGKIIPCQYDSISQNNSDGGRYFLVNTHKDGLIGYVNIVTGEIIPPLKKDPLSFEFNSALNLYYAKTGELTDDYYITTQAKKFYTLNTEYYIYKKHGLYGLSGYSDFILDNPEIMIIPPIYKKIEQTYIGDRMFAMNKKKLYGLINSFNDTIVPFNYTSYEISILDPEENDMLYQVFHGKKQGLMSVQRGELIPPIYDKIDYIFDYGFKVEGYLVQAYGKKGYYHPAGKVIVPCEFEIIECLNHSSDYFKTMLGKKKGKWYTWNYAQWEQNMNDSTVLSIGYDFIVGSLGYVIKGSDYDAYDLYTNEMSYSELNEPIEYSNDLYSIFCINGKCGVKNFEGKTLIEPLYDMIQFQSENIDFIHASENGIVYQIDIINNIRNIEINDQY